LIKVEDIGCTAAYAFAHFGTKFGFKEYLWCMKQVAQMGFACFEMEILRAEHLQMYTKEGIRNIRDKADELGLAIPLFTAWFTQPFLYSVDPDRRAKGLKLFQQSAEIGRDIGSTYIHLGSDFPPEFVQAYSKEYEGAPPRLLTVPEGYTWKGIWEDYVNVVGACVDIVQGLGMKLSVEPRANSLIWNAEGFLRLHEQVGSNSLGVTIDLLHHDYHRENLSLVVEKLIDYLYAIQLCDSDGASLNHLPLGQGKIDFKAFFQTLQKFDYKGLLNLELYGRGTEGRVNESYLESRLYVQKILKKID